MDKYLICFFLLIQIVLLILLVLQLRRRVELSEQFAIAQQTLMDIIGYYYSYIFFPKLENLKKQYDLDPNSRTHAIKAYQDMYNTMLSDASKEIIKKYLSDECLQKLLNYYSVDGLILLIISNLKR